jgi:RNA polymerase sigma-70 factor (ECF subfamily)
MRHGESFDEFYRATSRRLVQYAYALTGDLATAQDLVQEVYLRAWQRWSRLAEYEAADAWLRVVLSRLATDRWRRMRSMRTALARTGPPGAVGPPSDDGVLLVRAMRQLPDTQRRALALHYLYDMSVEDIAAETGSPSGTVKSWLSRGRTALAAALGDGTELGDRAWGVK